MNKYIKRGFTLIELLTAKQQGGRSKGFTLIELLIVMAILGVLAVVVLVAINPVQQLARTRDTGRKSAVNQVGHALQGFFTGRNGKFLITSNCPAVTAGGGNGAWMDCLQSVGELASVPSAINYSVGPNPCTSNPAVGFQGAVQNNLCYKVSANGDQSVVYASLESNSEAAKCPSTTPIPWFVWSSADGRSGLVCTANVNNEPGPGSQSGQPGWNL